MDITALTLGTPTGPSATQKTGTAKAGKDPAEQAARDFEAMMMTTMLESMFKGVRTDGLFGGGHSEEIWRTFMMQEYGRLIADSGVTGIGRSISEAMDSYETMRSLGTGQNRQDQGDD